MFSGPVGLFRVSRYCTVFVLKDKPNHSFDTDCHDPLPVVGVNGVLP